MTTETRHGEDFVPLSAAIFTYLSYGVLIVMGHFRDFCGRWLRFFGVLGRAPYAVTTEPGYAELLADFDSFNTRRLYTRIRGSRAPLPRHEHAVAGASSLCVRGAG